MHPIKQDFCTEIISTYRLHKLGYVYYSDIINDTGNVLCSEIGKSSLNKIKIFALQEVYNNSLIGYKLLLIDIIGAESLDNAAELCNIYDMRGLAKCFSFVLDYALKNTDKSIMYYRYGLSNNKLMSIQSMATKLSCSEDKIKNIIQDSLDILRRNRYLKLLTVDGKSDLRIRKAAKYQEAEQIRLSEDDKTNGADRAIERARTSAMKRDIARTDRLHRESTWDKEYRQAQEVEQHNRSEEVKRLIKERAKEDRICSDIGELQSVRIPDDVDVSMLKGIDLSDSVDVLFDNTRIINALKRNGIIKVKQLLMLKITDLYEIKKLGIQSKKRIVEQQLMLNKAIGLFGLKETVYDQANVVFNTKLMHDRFKSMAIDCIPLMKDEKDIVNQLEINTVEDLFKCESTDKLLTTIKIKSLHCIYNRYEIGYIKLLASIIGLKNFSNIDYLARLDLYNLGNNIDKLLSMLGARDATIISYRYNLKGVKLTRSQMAKDFGVAEQTITEVTALSLQKLQQSNLGELFLDKYNKRIKHTTHTADFNADFNAKQSNNEKETGTKSEILNRQVSELGLSNRALNVLNRNGIFTTIELIRLDPTELSEIRGIGKDTCQEINGRINEICLALRLRPRNMKRRRVWTDKENRILIRYYETGGANEVYERLEYRSLTDIKKQAIKLGLVKHRNISWSDDESDLIRKYYPVEGREIANRLPNRTIDAIIAQAFKLGVRGLVKTRAAGTAGWSDDENDLIRQYYTSEGKGIVHRLPYRTIVAIQAQAYKLGVRGPARRVIWTENENNILRTYYSTEGINVLSRLPGRTELAVKAQAHKLGIY